MFSVLELLEDAIIIQPVLYSYARATHWVTQVHAFSDQRGTLRRTIILNHTGGQKLIRGKHFEEALHTSSAQAMTKKNISTLSNKYMTQCVDHFYIDETLND